MHCGLTKTRSAVSVDMPVSESSVIDEDVLLADVLVVNEELEVDDESARPDEFS